MHRARTILLVACLTVAFAFAQTSHKSGHCPIRESVPNCTPRCVSDFECPFNQKCCPNKCATKSCSESSVFNTGNGYKGSQNGDVYCAGIKCRPHEKCKFDRKTKREKCAPA